MAIFEGLIADIWADPMVRITGLCPQHPEGNDNCLDCRVAVIARWDVALARHMLALRADYCFANVVQVHRHLSLAGMQHLAVATIREIRAVVREECPFDPDLPPEEV